MSLHRRGSKKVVTLTPVEIYEDIRDRENDGQRKSNPIIDSQPLLFWKVNLLKHASTRPECVSGVLAVNTGLDGMCGTFAQI